MNIDSASSVFLNNTEIIRIEQNGTTIWEKSVVPSVDYFYIQNEYNGSNTIYFKVRQYYPTPATTDLEYSTDKQNWTQVTIQSPYSSFTLGKNKKLYLRSSTGFSNSSGYISIDSSGNFSVGGDIMSLMDYTNIDTVSLTEKCFWDLFYGANHLIDASQLKLPRTTLATRCYENMFGACTSLTSSQQLPTLPATTLANYCYEGMFKDCSALTDTPSLPATTLATGCYMSMFENCTSLTDICDLPSTTLATSCYSSMFKGCTSITFVSKNLPATTMVSGCYSSMFENCTSLTSTTPLPALKLATSCYSSMFKGCTSINDNPVLPATTLTDYCYQNMFNGCSSLRSITTYANDISATGCTTHWLLDVYSSGNFYNMGSASYSGMTEGDGIPRNWTKYTPNNYFYIKNTYNGANQITITTTKAGSPTSGTYSTSLQYSTDRSTWTTVNFSTSSQKTITFNKNQTVYFRNNSGYFNSYESNSKYYYTTFNCAYRHDVGGNIKSLLDYDNMSTVALNQGCFTFLLSGDTSLVNSTNLRMNVNTIQNYAYRNLFNGCTNLLNLPDLSNAKKVFYAGLNRFCYGCTKITTGVNLKQVTQIDGYGLGAMYYGCSSLTEATAPNISTWDTTNSNNWLYGVAASGVVKKPSGLTITSNSPSGVPSGWTTQNY